MGGLLNVDCTGDPAVGRLVAVGDAFCHTDPRSPTASRSRLRTPKRWGAPRDERLRCRRLVERYCAEVTPEARERYALACDTDDARTRRWNGEPLDVGRRDGCYPLFAFAAALAAAPHDDLVLRRTIRRIGLLDRTDVFDEDSTCTNASRASSLRTRHSPAPRARPATNCSRAWIPLPASFPCHRHFRSRVVERPPAVAGRRLC